MLYYIKNKHTAAMSEEVLKLGRESVMCGGPGNKLPVSVVEDEGFKEMFIDPTERLTRRKDCISCHESYR